MKALKQAAWLFVRAMADAPAFACCIGFLVAIFASAWSLVLIPKMPKVVIPLLAPP
jgi:hypothetical protein